MTDDHAFEAHKQKLETEWLLKRWDEMTLEKIKAADKSPHTFFRKMPGGSVQIGTGYWCHRSVKPKWIAAKP